MTEHDQELRPLLEDQEANGLSTLLLRAAAQDGPSKEARRAALAAFGIGLDASVMSSLGASSAEAASSATLQGASALSVAGKSAIAASVAAQGGASSLPTVVAVLKVTSLVLAVGGGSLALLEIQKEEPNITAPKPVDLEKTAGPAERSPIVSSPDLGPKPPIGPELAPAIEVVEQRPLRKRTKARIVEPIFSREVEPTIERNGNIARELALLDAIKVFLRDAALDSAESTLAEYDHEFSATGSLIQEAHVLSIEMSVRRGRVSERDEKVRSFVERYPTSPLLGRVQSLIQKREHSDAEPLPEIDAR